MPPLCVARLGSPALRSLLLLLRSPLLPLGCTEFSPQLALPALYGNLGSPSPTQPSPSPRLVTGVPMVVTGRGNGNYGSPFLPHLKLQFAVPSPWVLLYFTTQRDVLYTFWLAIPPYLLLVVAQLPSPRGGLAGVSKASDRLFSRTPLPPGFYLK